MSWHLGAAQRRTGQRGGQRGGLFVQLASAFGRLAQTAGHLAAWIALSEALDEVPPPADLLETEAARVVLGYAGSWQMMIPRTKPAEEYSGALAQVTDAIANLWELAESGMFKDRAEQFKDRLNTHAAPVRLTKEM